MTKSMIFCSFLLSLQLPAQTRIHLETQSRSVDFGNADFTRPFKMGGALPSSCRVGEIFYLTSATTEGSQIHACTATDVWQLQSSPIQPGPAGAWLTTLAGAVQWLSPSGDLAGASSATQVTGLRGRPVANDAPASGQVLAWDGLAWTPQSLPGTPGTFTLESNGDPVGTAGVLNLVAGTGMVNVTGLVAGKLAVQQSVNTAVVLTKEAFQAGQPVFCDATLAPTGDEYACTLNPAPPALVAGMRLYLRANAAHDGPSLALALNGGAPVPVVRAEGGEPWAGEIHAGELVALWYDGTQFRMQQPSTSAVRVATSSPPACDADQRGRIWHQAGGAGTADSIQICVKNAADAYVWHAIY